MNDLSVKPADSVWGEKDVTSRKGAEDENFPVGSLLFARRNRAHVTAYYNFARVIDDMVDNAELSPEAKIARLRAMEAVLRGEREAPHRADAQTAVVLRRHLLETGVPLETAADLITAFCQDAVKNRYASWEELLGYCRYSANPVGRFLLLLHGEDDCTLPLSDALCSALQVLNHLQDVTADLKLLDRSYLPQDYLDSAGAQIDDVLLARSKPGLRRVFDRLLDEVDILNDRASVLPGLVRDRRMRAYCAVVLGLSRRLASRLRRDDPVASRVKLHKRDGALALGQGIRALFPVRKSM
ncbi:squalene/phytoene synthase family protein [Swaminathania salitolerans]|uniref:Squalene synthase HpnC n=1 Tax=Swaminathania salitolerans TaxID=182838 RepID=A0A511BSN8_9PROT|nr:squalene/phytoene synthase family protein [Swaminathania salitolerans]GBQ13364.1 phytoene synthase [Swaminathania salitolerans LMG 21291]GEL03295.1 squalene synthase HpnC [Swaminathania salitolerans]